MGLISFTSAHTEPDPSSWRILHYNNFSAKHDNYTEHCRDETLKCNINAEQNLKNMFDARSFKNSEFCEIGKKQLVCLEAVNASKCTTGNLGVIEFVKKICLDGK